jgi:pyrimidine-specific ribonucleoside hydrolase
MPPGPVVVCDPGVDDFVALLILAGAGQPPGAIIGTAGNVDAEMAFRNALAIASLLGLDCPVAQDAAHGLHDPYPDTGDPFHGADGLGGIRADLPAALATAPRPASLPLVRGSVIATGPLTVVAAALQAGQPVDEVVWMGGAVACGGNMTAAAEFNAWLDPEACDHVLASGVGVAMVPLDITHQVSLDPAELRAMGALGAVAALAARACSHFHATGAPAYPHDAVAVVAWLHPELFEWEERWVRCELAGSWTRGMTVVDRRRRGAGGSVRIPVGVDVAAVKERIFEALRALG